MYVYMYTYIEPVLESDIATILLATRAKVAKLDFWSQKMFCFDFAHTFQKILRKKKVHNFFQLAHWLSGITGYRVSLVIGLTKISK